MLTSFVLPRLLAGAYFVNPGGEIGLYGQILLSMSLKTWRYLLLATFLLVPVANYLPFLLELDTNRFADDRETRVDAAGYAFSIWGVIFTGMLLFAANQLRNEEDTTALRRAYRFLILAGLASIAFVPISLGNNQLLTFIDLLWHLLALIGAYVALREHARTVTSPSYGWTYFAPSMYLGWISAATVIATALALGQLGVSFVADTAIYIATGLVVVLTGLGLYLGLRQDGIYALTVAWALVAVAFEQQDTALIFYGALAGAGLLGAVAVARLAGKQQFFYP
jgi:hypothetical protein